MAQPSPELEAVMGRILRAIESRDLETLRVLFDPGERNLILGSDPKEWRGGQDALELFLYQIDNYPAFRYTTIRTEAFEEGTVGWLAADETAELESGMSVQLRKTVVFHLDAGVWRVVHWHSSRPTPEDPRIMGVEVTKNMARLLDSIDLAAEATTVRTALSTSTVTLVFTDIEGSTTRASEVGDDEWEAIIRSHFARITGIARAYGGVIVKTVGDGAIVAFDSARKGLEAAAAMLLATEGGAVATDPSSFATLRIRIGINTGDAIRTEDDYFGQMVNKTARIAAAARPGQILASDVVRGLVGETEGLSFGAPLSLELKGISGIQTVYPVVITSTQPAEPDT